MLARFRGARWTGRARLKWVLAAAVVLVALPAGAGAELVFVSNENANTISVFSVGANGQLSPVTCNPVSNCATGQRPAGLVLDPTDTYLYAADFGDDTVSQFSVAASGALTPDCNPSSTCQTTHIASGEHGVEPASLAVDAAGPYLYAGNYIAGSVAPFTIGAGGALTAIPCGNSRLDCVAAGDVFGVAIDPPFVYTGGDPVSIFEIGSGGALAPVDCTIQADCEVPAGDSATDVAVDPSGPYLYVSSSDTTGGGAVAAFKIGAGGSLTPVTCATCTTGFDPTTITVDPVAPYVYVADAFEDQVGAFKIGNGGALTPVACNPATNCEAGAGPDALAVDPTGHYLFAANSGNTTGSVSVFSIGSGGALTPIECTVTTSSTGCTAGDGSDGIAVDPNGGSTTTTTTTTTTTAPPPPPPALSGLAVSPRSFNRAGRKLKGHCVAPAAAKHSRVKCTRAIALKVAFTLTRAAKVTLTATLEATGRRVHGKCVAATKHNGKDPKCTRPVAVRGSVALNGRAGHNSEAFNGVVGGHALAAGRYVLTLTPAGGRPQTATVTITG
jgi:6-phosphogluconolactonase (cycloisomerase 2 family)